MTTLKFTKMHGLGNDYIYFNCFDQTIENPNELAKKLSDRHFGIGSDGIVLILPSKKADAMMRMFNADGTESRMCGNAIRCVGKYVYDNGIATKEKISIETLSGIKELRLFVEDGKVRKIKVDMDKPILEGKKIPVRIDKERIVNEKLEVDGKEFNFTAVSMGNPHCVIFVDKITDELVKDIGPKISAHKLFPNRANVEFVKVLNKKEVEMRVWERGAGETLACGTGACAACVAGVLNDLIGRKITVHLLGGDLQIEWAENDHVFKTGPAEVSFEGWVEV